MNYTTGAAFRRALEDRLRHQSLESGVPLIRLRKMVAFDRLLARLIQSSSDGWVLKGGLALQLRLEDSARTTKDIDLLDLIHQENIHQTLIVAGALNLADWFMFEIAKPVGSNREDFGGMRFPVRALLDGRTFEEFHLDIGIGDPIVDAIEFLVTPDLLKFAGIEPTIVPCYPISQQIAEKVHALTRHHPSGEGSRVKDLVDILLMAEIGKIDRATLVQALHATFDARQTHSLPTVFPEIPRSWSIPFSKMAEEVKLRYLSLDDASEAMRKFLDPIFSGEATGHWDPVRWSWRYE